jgi:hypothetical protein
MYYMHPMRRLSTCTRERWRFFFGGVGWKGFFPPPHVTNKMAHIIKWVVGANTITRAKPILTNVLVSKIILML